MSKKSIFSDREIKAWLEQLTGKNDNLGIPGSGFEYMSVKSNSDLRKEFLEQEKFLKTVFKENIIEKAPELVDPNMKLEFINYGDTQMVYVLTANGKQWSVLVTQPIWGCGVGLVEFNNLKRLVEICPNVVVKPEYYFTDGTRELYISPYIYQARCIASQNQGYGVYIPEPIYRFETFSGDTREVVNKCMVANLIRLYDEENELGIGSCKIGGGDFILEKQWEQTDKSIDATLKHMKLIAAREMLPMSFADYEQRILCEFPERTYYRDISERDPNILINCKNRVEMTFEEIGEGIELGKKLRKVRSEIKC